MTRIVSLAPSATATVRALGATDSLVGVTAHDEMESLPQLGGWLTPDLDRLAELDPDMVLTVDALQSDIRDSVRDRGFDVVHHDPRTLEAIFAYFSTLGTAIGREAAGRRLEQMSRHRLEHLRTITPDSRRERPVVYCEEWPDPPMAAGNWVPEVVEAAGGRYPFVDPGERSRRIDATAVIDAQPAHVVVHHCGRGEDASIDLDARNWLIDAPIHTLDDSLLNQPSPRLLDGAEALAELLHPDRTAAAATRRTQSI